jgi:hypothetical protein
MNVKSAPLTNALTMSLFMVNVAHALLHQFRRKCPKRSILDVKAHFRAAKHFKETTKMLPERPEPILLEQTLGNIASLGSIIMLMCAHFLINWRSYWNYERSINIQII